MSTPERPITHLPPRTLGHREPAQLADVLDRVLDKGIVVAGDIRIELLQIELLTIRLRLLIASADKAREMGINWWEGDPFLRPGRDGNELEERVKRLEAAAGVDGGEAEDDDRET